MAEDQSKTTGFLGDAENLGVGGRVEKLETHISQIFLAGDRAFKLKRGVKLPYVDFSTAELRLAACEKEVALNSRTAPDLYLGVRRITRENGGLAFDGDGELVDAVVEMKRFDQHNLLDAMAMEGRLTPRLMHDVAGMIARFHNGAPVVRGGKGAGSANMEGVLDINEAGFAISHVFDREKVAQFNARFREALNKHRGRLNARAERGRVRRCHGDLHLRNICLFDGVPTLFDCIEFNDQIATVDVLYDLAFLLMDLWHRALPDFANLVANRYLDGSDDEDGFCLLPFFMAVRAAVRAHVTATQVEEGAGDSKKAEETARSYFDLAARLLAPQTPHIIAIGGFSGTGKTTVAEKLAPFMGAPPGARIAESDRIRKALYRAPADTRLPAEAYQTSVSNKVYTRLGEIAVRIAQTGGTVIADAVFDNPDRRSAVEEAARKAGVRFTGIWLEADAETLRRRVARRSGGPSDATVAVLESQLERDIGEMRWNRVDAAMSPEEIVRAITEITYQS